MMWVALGELRAMKKRTMVVWKSHLPVYAGLK